MLIFQELPIVGYKGFSSAAKGVPACRTMSRSKLLDTANVAFYFYKKTI